MAIFTVRPDGPGSHYQLGVTPDLCVGAADMQFLFGGNLLGAVITAIERSAQRPVVWATAQYLSHAGPGSLVEIDVTPTLVGRHITQAMATARVGDRTIALVTAALGARPHAITAQWVAAPHVLPPDHCPDTFAWPDTALTLKQAFEIRPAIDANADAQARLGRIPLWIRPREHLPIDAPLLAAIADFTTAGVQATLGAGHVGNSLDNTLRICRIVPSRWVLCDIRIHGAHAGFAHGEMRLFAQTGDLLAIASQSMIVRDIR